MAKFGLYLRIDKKGRKQWVQRVVVGGKRVELGLGSFPISTLAMAREDALENKCMVRNGKAPRVERNLNKGNMTFANAVDRYLEIKLKEFRNDKHRKQWRPTLDNYALPEGAVRLLRDVPRLEGSEFVFFAPQGGMLSDMSLSAVMRKMQQAEERAGGVGYLDARSDRPAVPHGLRSTFRDWAAENEYDHVLAELALAHTVGSEVERAYRRTDMLSRRAMLEHWSAVLNGQSSPSD